MNQPIITLAHGGMLAAAFGIAPLALLSRRIADVLREKLGDAARLRSSAVEQMSLADQEREAEALMKAHP